MNLPMYRTDSCPLEEACIRPPTAAKTAAPSSPGFRPHRSAHGLARRAPRKAPACITLQREDHDCQPASLEVSLSLARGHTETMFAESCASASLAALVPSAANPNALCLLSENPWWMSSLGDSLLKVAVSYDAADNAWRRT